MTQGTIIPPAVDQDSIEYGHVYANYVKSVADTPGDPDADPDIIHVNGQVTLDSTFPGASARGSIRLPAEPRAYGLIVTGDTFEIVESKLVDHEGREGVRLIASVDGVPVSWQAVVTLTDSSGRTIYNQSYIIHYDLWNEVNGRFEINLPDLIPTPSRLEPPEGAAIELAARTIEQIEALTATNQQVKLDVEGLKSDVVTLHGQTGQRLTAAEAARAAAVTAKNAAEAAQSASETARSQAQTARATAVTKAGEASTSAGAAETARQAAETARATAVTKAGEASTSAGAAETARQAAETARSTAVTKAGEASSSAAAAQALHDDVAAAVAQFDADFAADMALFTGIRDDINLVANEVANDANRAEDAAQATEDALTVVRAHRWVPQGEWEYDLGYSAGDVVVHDGGSYYAQEDIPAGIEPPGGNWMVLGQGGITDAAELTGALTEYVDSSQAIVNLGSYLPGVEPELQAAQLVAILGHLYLSLESSVEASRVTGALTDQVDASGATVPNPNTEFATQYPLGTFVQEMATGLTGLLSILNLKADWDHTHTGDEVTLNVPLGDGSTFDIPLINGFLALDDRMGTVEVDKADIVHSHQVYDILADGEPSATTYLRGDNTWATLTAAEVGAEPAQWYGTQAEYDALATKDPNRTYNILEG